MIDQAIQDYVLLPCGRDSKRSLARWKEREFSLDELVRHIARGGNIGCRVGQTRRGIFVVVVDQDDRGEATNGLIAEHGLDQSNMQTITASGKRHLWFRVAEAIEKTRIKLDGLPLDVKASGYVLFPPSTIGGGEYRFADGKGLKRPEDLVELPQSFRERISVQPCSKPTTPLVSRRNDAAIRNLRAYIGKIPSVEGQNGSKGLMRVCYVLTERLGFDEAMSELHAWNAEVPQPSWSDKELVRALTRAFEKGKNL